MNNKIISRLNCLKTLLLLFPLISVAVSQDANITIPLNKTLSLKNKELYGDFLTIKSNSLIKVNCNNINKDVTFIIFQVHSHFYNVTIYNNSNIRDSHVTGTNVGLYSSVKPSVDIFYILNEHAYSFKLYISVHGYGKADPIPGGANMEYPVPISPFMYARYNKDYVNVDAAPPQPIQNSKAIVKFYMMYLSERAFDEETYFRGLKEVLTLDKIQENGVEIIKGTSPNLSLMRRMVSAYPGVGTIYVAVAYDFVNENWYSVYVPTHTYACDLSNERTCNAFDDVTADLACAALLFIGIFTCYFGHRFFKTEMFIMGMFFGIIVTYILISLMTDLTAPALVVASVISGVFFGAIWLLFWWFYGIPFFAVLMTTLHLGFLCSAIFYYRLPGGLELVESNGVFWTAFIGVTILTAMTLITATFLSNIVGCAVLGAYAAVFSIDYYLGSNLKYIIINTVRRAVVEKFRLVTLSPPFQWRDASVTVLWVLLAITGVLFQHYHNRGRPPFPPPPRSMAQRLPELPQFIRAYRNRRYGTLENENRHATIPHATDPIVYDERSPLI